MTDPRVTAFVEFYTKWIDPEKAYVVIGANGASRFITARLAAAKPVCVVSTSRGGPIPIRAYHIYAIDPDSSGIPSQPDSVSAEIGKAISLGMCGDAKLGAQITLGEIHTASRAQVLARLEVSSDDDIVKPTGASDATSTTGVNPEKPLPLTAVVICVGDTVRSEPFDTPEEAMQSETWRMLHQTPEVILHHQIVHAYPVYPDITPERGDHDVPHR